MAATAHIADARKELHDLRVEEWSDIALGALAIGLSLVATEYARTLALPLFLGGVTVTILAGRAFFRRWDLSERLMLDPDAYEISEIHNRAERVAALANRTTLAHSIRAVLESPGIYRWRRVEAVRDELAGLADELEDETLSLEPLCAVRCQRLLTDGTESPLLNQNVPADGLAIAIKLIRAGFEQTS